MNGETLLLSTNAVSRVVWASLMISLDNEVQLAKAHDKMDVTFSGIISSLIEEQPAKV